MEGFYTDCFYSEHFRPKVNWFGTRKSWLKKIADFPFTLSKVGLSYSTSSLQHLPVMTQDCSGSAQNWWKRRPVPKTLVLKRFQI